MLGADSYPAKPDTQSVGAVEAGIALWYITNGHWNAGAFLAIAVAFLIAEYYHRERKAKGQRGKRRY